MRRDPANRFQHLQSPGDEIRRGHDCRQVGQGRAGFWLLVCSRGAVYQLMTQMLKRRYGKTNSGNRETVRLQSRHK
jgi:hypothetical protein